MGRKQIRNGMGLWGSCTPFGKRFVTSGATILLLTVLLSVMLVVVGRGCSGLRSAQPRNAGQMQNALFILATMRWTRLLCWPESRWVPRARAVVSTYLLTSFATEPLQYRAPPTHRNLSLPDNTLMGPRFVVAVLHTLRTVSWVAGHGMGRFLSACPGHLCRYDGVRFRASFQ